jgi:hypothetical protein
MYLILAYSRQSGYPALETHSHASAYTDQGAYRLQATMHASHRITHYSRVSPLADVATLLPTRNMSPMQYILQLAERSGVVVYQQFVSAYQ